MKKEDLLPLLKATLVDVAPDLAGEDIPEAEDIREALDIDSMDFLNFVTALHEKLGVDIPEADYPRLFTLEGAAAYLEAKL